MLEHMANVFLPSCEDTLDEAVGERKIFYRLGESEFFQYANKNTGSGGLALIDIIPRMVVENQGFDRIYLDRFDKSLVYELFESARYKLNCKAAMKAMLESGDVVLVYSSQYRIPTSIPYIVQTSKLGTKVFANISDFVEMDQYGKYNVVQTRNYNALMAVIFAACIAQRIVSRKSMLPASLLDGFALSYATMLETVINSLVHMDPVMQDKMKYLATEFALIQMYGTETGTKLFYRYKDKYYPKLSKLVTDTIDNQFQLDHFDNMTLFIEELKKNYPSMKGLTPYLVMDKWIRRYGPATVMSIDYLGYHLYTICMILMESPLITRMTMEPIMVKNKGTEMYRELQNII